MVEAHPSSSTPAVGAVVIHCSEAAFQPYYQEFLKRGLHLESYAVFAVPGGPHCLTLADTFPRFSWAGWRWMEFLMQQTKAERIVLIAHDDCRWYHDPRFGFDPKGIPARQAADLQLLRRRMAEHFGEKRVDLYFAQLEGGRARFEVVT
ncbi:MAG TPA: hypothetical protein VNN18_07045 [Candidatus Xenobia bacterium]|nr:hypothetical protein [Candidatus Xenobia bacterium]